MAVLQPCPEHHGLHLGGTEYAVALDLWCGQSIDISGTNIITSQENHRAGESVMIPDDWEILRELGVFFYERTRRR